MNSSITWFDKIQKCQMEIEVQFVQLNTFFNSVTWIDFVKNELKWNSKFCAKTQFPKHSQLQPSLMLLGKARRIPLDKSFGQNLILSQMLE